MPDDTTQTEWITSHEARRLTDYSLDHLRRLARNQTVHARKMLGVVWLFDRDDLLRHQAQAKPGPKHGEADQR